METPQQTGRKAFDPKFVKELLSPNTWFIEQIKEWGEIVLGVECENKYKIKNETGQQIGFVAEFSDHSRFYLGSHRPFVAAVFNTKGIRVLEFERPSFLFWSSMKVLDGLFNSLGTVNRRFSLLDRKYKLSTEENVNFNTVYSKFSQFWTFELLDHQGEKIGQITKNWSGAVQEFFTDADNFTIKLEGRGTQLNLKERSILLGTAISIDFDFFENNVCYSALGTLTGFING